MASNHLNEDWVHVSKDNLDTSMEVSASSGQCCSDSCDSIEILPHDSSDVIMVTSQQHLEHIGKGVTCEHNYYS
jgi:hypothetical protein